MTNREKEKNYVLFKNLQISLGGKAHGFNRGMKAFYFKKCVYPYCIYTHLMI